VSTNERVEQVKNILALGIAGALLASVANAQTYGGSCSGNFCDRSATITSGSTIAAKGLDNTSGRLDVVLTASTPVSVALVAGLSSGRTVSSVTFGTSRVR
jgi:hypothetical protein